MKLKGKSRAHVTSHLLLPSFNSRELKRLGERKSETVGDLGWQRVWRVPRWWSMLFLWKHLIASNVNADEQIHRKTEQNTNSIVGGGGGSRRGRTRAGGYATASALAEITEGVGRSRSTRRSSNTSCRSVNRGVGADGEGAPSWMTTAVRWLFEN